MQRIVASCQRNGQLNASLANGYQQWRGVSGCGNGASAAYQQPSRQSASAGYNVNQSGNVAAM